MNIFGGEERFWMGPEGSRFFIFRKGKIGFALTRRSAAPGEGA